MSNTRSLFGSEVVQLTQPTANKEMAAEIYMKRIYVLPNHVSYVIYLKGKIYRCTQSFNVTFHARPAQQPLSFAHTSLVGFYLEERESPATKKLYKL